MKNFNLSILAFVLGVSTANASILCKPLNPTEGLNCVSVDIPNEAYDSDGSQQFISTATAYLSDDKTLQTRVELEMLNGNIEAVHSNDRGFQLDLSWKNFVDHGSNGADINAERLSIFDRRVSYTGLMRCGGSSDNKMKKACGLK
ncbi:MAG: hypothetical protein ACXVB4_02375, partial [Pseudobdellovibrionaceae bacterium]